MSGDIEQIIMKLDLTPCGRLWQRRRNHHLEWQLAACLARRVGRTMIIESSLCTRPEPAGQQSVDAPMGSTAHGTGIPGGEDYARSA